MPAGEQRAAVLGHHKLAGHHQVHPQMRIAVQIDDEHLAAPGDGGEPPPDELSVERRPRRGQRLSREHLDGLDAPAKHGRQQPASDGLDLGELRHDISISLAKLLPVWGRA